MLTKVKQLKDCEAEMFVELEKEELQSYVKKTGEQISKLVQVDGFRAGKVPLDVLRKNIGDQKILEEALELAVTDSLAKALKKENLEIISSSDLKVTENTPDSLKYSIKILAFPKIKIGEYKNLNVVKKEFKVEDREVENTIAHLLKSHAQYKESDAPSERGNHLEIDFEVTHDGETVEGGKSENHPLALGNGNFIPGFEDHLAGLKKGETKSFSLEAPKDYYQKNIAGKKLDFKVTIKSVKTGKAPELTDEFVKTLGNFSSAEDLKNSIAEGLKAEKERKEKDRIRLEILDKVGKNSEIKIPEKLIEEQLEGMIKNFDQSLHERGMELSLYLAHLKKTEDDLKKDWRTQAEEQIRRGLIMREIGKKENISVSEGEVEEATSALLSGYLAGGQGKDNIDPIRLKQKAEDAILHEKIFEFLEKNNARN